ncbi:MAG: thiamine pyrophosphate-dependent enzyme [Chloroflexota bacterium]|nr:thiamine pyrophosphate-dependent enzyme [Chloroflexota bacterium]MEE2656435.1 thiamine pyrophosphate-dependent enzyme [Chloroflexota bacterium]
MLRHDAIRAILERVKDEPIISNLGGTTFHLHNLSDRDANLYTWGAMGLASSIGLGVALAAPSRKVIVMDGDGSLLMNLGSLGTIARQNPSNLIHIVWDNHQWAGTGGQPTHTAGISDLAAIARGSGIPRVESVSTLESLEEIFDRAMNEKGPWCIVADVEGGDQPIRPEVSIEENLQRFRKTFHEDTC